MIIIAIFIIYEGKITTKPKCLTFFLSSTFVKIVLL